MSKKYPGSITTTGSFIFNAGKPLDDRLVVETKADLASLTTYNGIIVYVEEDKTHYKYDGNTWSSVGGGNLTNKNNGQATDLWIGTQRQYEALTEKDNDVLYVISDVGKKLLWKSETGGATLGDKINNNSDPYSTDIVTNIFTHTESLIGKKLEIELESNIATEFFTLKIDGQASEGLTELVPLIQQSALNHANLFAIRSLYVAIGISEASDKTLCGVAYTLTKSLYASSNLTGGSDISVTSQLSGIQTYKIKAVYEIID